MLPVFARGYDHFLGAILARLVGRPRGFVPQPVSVPATPEELPELPPLDLGFQEKEKDVLHFQAARPVPSPWQESQVLCGRAFGPVGARAAVVVLHGACDTEYTWVAKFGRAFSRHGFRVLTPAAPCHLERTPAESISGAPMFWSTERTIAGVAQWLAEVHALVGWLRAQGAETVGVLGFSLGSLVAGLAATLWPDLDFVAVLAPVGHHLQAIRRSSIVRGMWPWMRKATAADALLFDRWAPLYRKPVVQRLLFLMTLFDDLQPTDLQRAWWRAWGQPPHHEYRHGHMSVLFSKQLPKDLEQFAAQLTAAPATRPRLLDAAGGPA